MRSVYPFFSLFVLLILSVVGQGQTLPLGIPSLDDYYRRQQLLGNIDSTISFNIRPLTAETVGQREHLNYPESDHTDIVWQSDVYDGYLRLLPVVLDVQLNTAYPYGWNDGPMIPAKGIQTYLSTGFFAKYRWLSVQFKPEFVTAQNKAYKGFGGDSGPNIDWYSYLGNLIDMPELFGIGSFTKAYLGQSSIRLTLDPVSLGISTENIWWGPGRRNSILMSNTAPGFPHLTLNTAKPIHTYIGSFEGQIVLGRLTKSGFPPSLLGDTARHMQYIVDKPAGKRYLSGITLNYQPRWVPGFFIGLSRVYNSNPDMEGSFIQKYLPFLEALTAKQKIGPDSADEGIPRDQMISFFFRYVIPKAQMEFYGEYAKNDHNYDARDAVLQLNHTRAYTLGLRKIVSVAGFWSGDLQIAAEMTQMAVTDTRRIRASGSWYAHVPVRDGYTNQGQLLGAGIGPGGNVQEVDFSWIRGLKQVGVQFERLVHNEDFATWILQDYRRNWVDASIAAYGTWDYKRFIFNAHLQFIHAYNYQYGFRPAEDLNDYWGFDPQDKNNLHLRLGLMYRF
ncbi:capsule assembly Wzi family protein [Parapedobacter sp. DT-150]